MYMYIYIYIYFDSQRKARKFWPQLLTLNREYFDVQRVQRLFPRWLFEPQPIRIELPIRSSKIFVMAAALREDGFDKLGAVPAPNGKVSLATIKRGDKAIGAVHQRFVEVQLNCPRLMFACDVKHK